MDKRSAPDIHEQCQRVGNVLIVSMFWKHVYTSILLQNEILDASKRAACCPMRDEVRSLKHVNSDLLKKTRAVRSGSELFKFECAMYCACKIRFAWGRILVFRRRLSDMMKLENDLFL